MVENKEGKKFFRLEKVATETADVVISPDGEELSFGRALVEILNRLNKLEKGLL